ncbi:MAG: helix-turn-helix domain-containing protein [Ruminococcus sp.]
MNNLQKIRKQAGLSQSQLAESSGVSFRMIQKYETGDRDINNASAITVFKLAQTLKVNVEDLINKK